MNFPMTPAMWSAATQAGDNVRRSVHRLHASVDRDGHQLAPEAARQKYALMTALQGFASIGQTTMRPGASQALPNAAPRLEAQLSAGRAVAAIER
ncbi:MAG: hypothetical protein HOV68_18495 [Streptomycetaceae bacterium]|nr:hypothetical protein [Streptomycetaceae bacterium]